MPLFLEQQQQKCLHPCVQIIFSRIFCVELNKASCRRKNKLPERLTATECSYRAAVPLLQHEQNNSDMQPFRGTGYKRIPSFPFDAYTYQAVGSKQGWGSKKIQVCFLQVCLFPFVTERMKKMQYHCQNFPALFWHIISQNQPDLKISSMFNSRALDNI